MAGKITVGVYVEHVDFPSEVFQVVEIIDANSILVLNNDTNKLVKVSAKDLTPANHLRHKFQRLVVRLKTKEKISDHELLPVEVTVSASRKDTLEDIVSYCEAVKGSALRGNDTIEIKIEIDPKL